MIEAYRIGVNLALSGTIAADVGKVASQFDALNQVIRRSQMAVNELASGMRALSRVGQSAADAWARAAGAMERAARATRQAATSGVGSAPSGGGGPAAGSGMAIVAAALASRPGTALIPYSGGATTTPGPIGGGSFPRLRQQRGLAAVNGGSFAGGPGTGTAGTALMATGGGSGGAGGIPLNYTAGPQFPAMPSHGDLAGASIGFGIAGGTLLGFTKAIGEAGLEAGHLQAQLRGLGFTQEQSDKARALALEEQRNTSGMTATGALEIIRDLGAVTQNPHEALDANTLQAFSRAGVVLSAAGKGGAIHELFQAMQAGELRGVLKAGPDGQISTETLQGFLRNVITTTLVTGGRIGPAEQLQFIKSAGIGGALLSDRALFADAIAPILSMGAAGAGSGVQGFAQQFAVGRMSDAGAKLLMEMGLLTLPAGHELKEYKAGVGQFHFPPSVLTGINEARSTPTDWIMKTLLPRIDAFMAKSEGQPRDAEAQLAQRMAAASMVSARIPGGKLIGDIIRNYALIERDREAIAKGADRDAFANAQTDPRVKMQAFGAAMNGLLTALSGPVMDTAIGIIKNLTDALNAISRWAEANPDQAGKIVAVATALGTLSVAIAGLSAALLLAMPMIRMARWVAGVGGATAGTAAAAATGGGGVLSAIGAGLRGLFSGGASAAGGGLAGAFAAQHPEIINESLERQMRRIGRHSGVAPSGQPDMNVQLRGNVTVDGRKIGEVAASSIAKQGSGPSGGTTGFDARAGYVGGMQ